MAALVYDILLILPLIMAAVALVMGARTLMGIGPDADGAVQLDANLVRAVALLTVMAFFAWFWLKNGQTLGMQAWRIKLIGFEGGAPTFPQILLRCLGAVVSGSCLGLGYLWCLIDSNGRYWHDYLSRTELILLPKKSKSKRGNGSTADS